MRRHGQRVIGSDRTSWHACAARGGGRGGASAGCASPLRRSRTQRRTHWPWRDLSRERADRRPALPAHLQLRHAAAHQHRGHREKRYCLRHVDRRSPQPAAQAAQHAMSRTGDTAEFACSLGPQRGRGRSSRFPRITAGMGGIAAKRWQVCRHNPWAAYATLRYSAIRSALFSTHADAAALLGARAAR